MTIHLLDGAKGLTMCGYPMPEDDAPTTDVHRCNCEDCLTEALADTMALAARIRARIDEMALPE